jgi:hypothetical protein
MLVHRFRLNYRAIPAWRKAKLSTLGGRRLFREIMRERLIVRSGAKQSCAAATENIKPSMISGRD